MDIKIYASREEGNKRERKKSVRTKEKKERKNGKSRLCEIRND